jgi:hypothetical protein
MKALLKILDGGAEITVDIECLNILKSKYVPFTSVDVDRSF